MILSKALADWWPSLYEGGLIDGKGESIVDPEIASQIEQRTDPYTANLVEIFRLSGGLSIRERIPTGLGRNRTGSLNHPKFWKV